MLKSQSKKILASSGLSVVVLALYVFYFRFIYVAGDMQCHLVSCLPGDELTSFWIRPTCCGYSPLMLAGEIALVLISSFVIAFVVLSIIKLKK